MAIQGLQEINVGLPNESTGSDSLFTAFTKTKDNFTNLFANASPTPLAGNGIAISNIANAITVSANLVAGNNIILTSANGAIVIDSLSGNGGGNGSITGVIAGTGLAGGGFFGNVTLNLTTSGVAAAQYTNPTITIDAQGRITSASNNIVAGTVTSVGLVPGSGVSISGGPITGNGNITVTNTGVTRLSAGTGISLSSSNGNVTVSTTVLGGTVTSVGVTSSQLVVSGSPVVSSGTISVNLPNNVTFSGNVTTGNVFANSGTIRANIILANSGNINGNLVVTGNISPAASNKVGGIKPGPGVIISLDGELTIDTANLPLSFGNFTANTNVLSIVNVDEDMILQTEGNAEIQLIGNIGFYKPDGLPPNVANRYFSATSDGQIKIVVANTDPFLGGVEIVGTGSGNIIAPGTAGTMLHITGQQSDPARVYIDGNDDYVSLVARRWNGNVDVPTQVLADEYVLRINSTAATDAGVGNVAMAQIGVVALENQTTTAQGSKIEFTVTPIGNTAANRVAVADITVANGMTATKFTTAGTLSVTANANVGNIGAAAGIFTANVTAGNILSSGAITSNSATAGVGYRTGAGGAVTQLTDKSTAVTLNTITGEITMSGVQLSGDATVSFTLNNSSIANTDVIILNQVSDANIGFYSFNGKCNSGNAVVSVHNITNTNRSDAIVIRYAVIKAATS